MEHRDSIDDQALANSYKAIAHDLGDLGDLPKELATTVANVYYRFFSMPKSLRISTSSQGLNQSYKNYMETFSSSVASFKFTKELVNSARQTREENAQVFQYLVTLTLDELKYRITDADKKTPLRRSLERRFKHVDEIPNLLEIMAERDMALYRAKKISHVETLPVPMIACVGLLEPGQEHDVIVTVKAM